MTPSPRSARPSTRQTKNKCPRVDHSKARLIGPEGQHAALRCKSWRECGPCADENRRRLLASITAACERRPELRRFVTLTLPGKWHRGDLSAGWREIGRMWSKLRRRIGRQFGRVPYVWVREGHRSGACHMHILVERYIPKGWLEDAWAACGGGWVDIRAADPQRAAAYLAKYMSKLDRATLVEPLPKGVRKYGSSGDLGVTIRGGAPGWHLQAPVATPTGTFGDYGPPVWTTMGGHEVRDAMAQAMRSAIARNRLLGDEMAALVDVILA